MRISDSSYILKPPADCSFQIDGKMRNLGSYDDEADAARAFDRVARSLYRPLNFSDTDPLEVAGPKSEGADQAVADAVEAAKTFMDKQAAKNGMQAQEWAKRAAERAIAKHAAEVQSQKLRASHGLTTYKPTTLTIFEQTKSSEYTGLYPAGNKWRPQIRVSQDIENI